eukprot:scaffold90563_cov63-Phaeocystis_antarctica.AAC.2
MTGGRALCALDLDRGPSGRLDGGAHAHRRAQRRAAAAAEQMRAGGAHESEAREQHAATS